MSVRKIAAQLGIGKSVAGEMVKAGMPSTDVTAAREWMKQHPRRPRIAPVGQERPGARGKHGHATQSEPINSSASDYTSARADRERSRAARERMDLLEAQGKSIGIDEAVRAAGTVFRVLRDGIDNVPNRIGDAVAAESDPFIVKQMMREELTKVLANFDVAAAVRELPDDETDDDGA